MVFIGSAIAAGAFILRRKVRSSSTSRKERGNIKSTALSYARLGRRQGAKASKPAPLSSRLPNGRPPIQLDRLSAAHLGPPTIQIVFVLRTTLTECGLSTEYFFFPSGSLPVLGPKPRWSPALSTAPSAIRVAGAH